MKRIIAGLLLSFALIGCDTSSIEETVKSSMQETFNTDANFKGYNLKVKEVLVVNNAGNSYKGMATVIYKGKDYKVPVDITSDGSRVMWQTEPGSMLFIVQDALNSFGW
jgi:hypothetical protein